jgi:hypothetical protein
MELFIQYERKPVIKALRYHFLARFEVRIMFILINVFSILAAVLFFFKKIQPITFFVFSGLWFLILLAIWYWLPFSIYARTRTFKEKIVATFGEKDFMLEVEKGKKVISWKTFKFYKESPDFFYLYMDERSFFLIPKASCTIDTPVEAVRAKIQEELNLG